MDMDMDMNILENMRQPYKALINEEWKKVDVPDKTMIVFPMTDGKDTVLHLAVYSGEEEPLKTLLALISEMETAFWTNIAGNTPLHEAAKVGNLAAVKLLVEYKKDDLLEKNSDGETPLFRAAKCGHYDIVHYVLEECDDYLSRSSRNWRANDKPIIHAAIESQNFEVVLRLIAFDKSLLEMKDSQEKSALHVLANMPLSFRSGNSMKLIESTIYKMLPNEDIYNGNYSSFRSSEKDGYGSSHVRINNEDLEAGSNSGPPHKCWHSNCWLHILHFLTCLFWRFIFLGWPHWKTLYKKKQHHGLALTIAKMLVHIDLSWHQTRPIPENTEVHSSGIQKTHCEMHKINGEDLDNLRNDTKKEISDIEYNDHHETPLLLAAANGIIEIVEKIVEAYPQAIDYVTIKQRNVLHVAIAHRQKNVFKWIKNRRLIMTRLVTRIDGIGFTALHHVGITKFFRGGTHGPALQLQEELKWYERVECQIPALYTMHHSDMNWTAREFFCKTHEKMLEEAKEWLKKTSESCSAVAVLVATVVFAAAYTVPGGLNTKTGTPVLLNEPIYIVFTVMDILALATALTSVVLFLSILTSSFKMEDFLITLPSKLSIGFQLLFFSVASTMMAFALTIVLTVKSEELKWTVSLLYMATFFPVSMFIIIQLPLYVELVKNIWCYRHHISKILPMGFLFMLWKLSSKTLSRKFV